MNLLRFVGRTLLAGYVVSTGLWAVRRPDDFVPAADPLAEKVVPLLQRSLPPAATAYVPQDTRSLVRLNGAAQVAGGLAMFTGIGRRPGACVAAATMLPHVLTSKSAAGYDRSAQRALLAKNLALLGAALVVSQDTQGNPSLLWRAQDRYARLQRDAARSQKQLTKDADRLRRLAARKAAEVGKTVEGALP